MDGLDIGGGNGIGKFGSGLKKNKSFFLCWVLYNCMIELDLYNRYFFEYFGR